MRLPIETKRFTVRGGAKKAYSRLRCHVPGAALILPVIILAAWHGSSSSLEPTGARAADVRRATSTRRWTMLLVALVVSELRNLLWTRVGRVRSEGEFGCSLEERSGSLQFRGLGDICEG